MWLACLLLLAMVPAWAADLPQEVTDAAPPAAEELEGKDFSGGIAALLEQGTTLLGEALRGNLRGAVLILGVVLLCGAADAVLRTPESPMRRFLPMAGAAAIAVLSLGSMKSLLGLGTQTIEELDVFSTSFPRRCCRRWPPLWPPEGAPLPPERDRSSPCALPMPSLPSSGDCCCL